jgi:hypothetical protein
MAEEVESLEIAMDMTRNSDSRSTAQPNILLICTDQHRHDFVGYLPHAPVRTPNLAALARRGTVFTHAVTPSAICAPARCAMASGLQPRRLGCLNNHDSLPSGTTTFYQRLRSGGYWTGFVGKLDLHKSYESSVETPDGRLPLLFDLGFCDPMLCGGLMRPLATPTKNPYFAHLSARGQVDTFNADRRSRCLLPGLVDVMNTRVGQLDLRTAGLPEDWVARVSKDSPFSGDDHTDGFVAAQAMGWIKRVCQQISSSRDARSATGRLRRKTVMDCRAVCLRSPRKHPLCASSIRCTH